MTQPRPPLQPIGPVGPVDSVPPGASGPARRGASKGRLVLRRAARSPRASAGAALLAIAVLFATFGNVPNAWRHDEPDLAHLGVPPGVGGHWLGTTGGGLDVWALLVQGSGRSLVVGLLVGTATPLIAGLYGATIAYWGGRRERAGIWLLDMLILLPSFLVVAVVMGAGRTSAGIGGGPSGPGGSVLTLALLLTLFGWMGPARVVRAQTTSLREREFVVAARYLGVSSAVVIRRHLLPHLASLLLISVVLSALGAIVAETALSFLGVGIRPPDVSLGRLLAQGASQVYASPWTLAGPVVCLIWITAGLALLGDGLRDALDPGSRAGARG